ncbi:MAG: RecT family recombinase [Verrucomicrobiota bacterium]
MTTENKATPAIVEKNISDQVLAKINQFQQAGALTLPKDYSAENALKSAFLILQETIDRDKNPVLQVCTKESVASSLLDMVVQGLSPMKKQCYFIAYGKKLQLSRSYQGSVAIAKRVGMKEVVANVIYEGDEFIYEIIAETGRKKVVKHEQKIQNIDLKKIVGAYAITEMTDGTKDVTLMNMLQIRNAWNQGAAKGNSGAHTNFTDEMACKTVIQRACKPIINSSDDSHLYDEDEEKEVREQKVDANVEEIGFEDMTTPANVQPEPVPEPKQETTAKEEPKVQSQAIPGF